MNRRSPRRRLITRNGLVYSLLLCLLILGLGGLGFWMIEPRASTFGDGLWLAFTTAATVGYGDIVPTTLASRVFSVLVALLGLAVLSLVTASVAAMFVQREERQIEHDLLHAIGQLRAEIKSLRDEVGGLRNPATDDRDPASDATRPGATVDMVRVTEVSSRSSPGAN